MPSYDYQCVNCGLISIHYSKYDDRDKPRHCDSCEDVMVRIYAHLNTRTEKTSRSFLDGHRNDGLSEEIKAAELDRKAMQHDYRSTEYKELKAEAKVRRLFNTKAGKDIANKTKVSKSKSDK